MMFFKLKSLIFTCVLILQLNSSYGQSYDINLLNEISTTSNTADKPQSKIWKYDGYWWSVFPDVTGTHVWKLNSVGTWVNVFTISTEISTNSDCKQSGDKAFILLFNGANSELINLQYNSLNSTYELLNVSIPSTNLSFNSSTETVTLDIDGENVMWLAYEQNGAIKVNSSLYPYTSWGNASTIETGVNNDDICSIKALPGKIAVFWSNSVLKEFGCKFHNNGDIQSNWSIKEQPGFNQSQPNLGGGLADDHINLASTSHGDLYCAIKTDYDNDDNTYPQIGLFKRNFNGVWDDLYYIDSSGTRPIIIIDEINDVLQVIYTDWIIENGNINASGDILFKESSLTNISFGVRNTLIQSNDYNNTYIKYNNVSSTKDNYDCETVVLASSQSAPFTTVGVKLVCKTINILENNTNSQVEVFPNPFNSSCKVLFNNTKNDAYQFSVYDLNGRIVQTYYSTSEHIEILKGNLKNGMYFYRLQNLKTKHVESNGKIVIE